MKVASVFASCAVALCLPGCGDDDGSSAYSGPPPSEVAAPTPPAPTTTTAPATTTPPAAATDTEGGVAATTPVAAEAGVPAIDTAARCSAVLANSWTSLQPALAMVGSEIAQPEAEYVSNKFFIKRCSGLTAPQLDCLSKSETPLVGIADCKVNEGKKSGDKLRLPSFRKQEEKPADLPPKEQAKLLRSVVGTWKNEFKSYKQTKIWKINKSGEVKQTSSRSGKSEEKVINIKFERPGMLRVETTPTSSQWYSYLPVNQKTMFLCNNLAYGAHPISDEADFVLATKSEYIALKGEVCKVLTDSGHFLDAECTWEQKSRKEKTFSVSYQAPDRKSATQLSYDLIADHLVDQRQVESSKFVRR